MTDKSQEEKVFEKAQKDPKLEFEMAELSGYTGSGIIKTIFFYAYRKGKVDGFNQVKNMLKG